MLHEREQVKDRLVAEAAEAERSANKAPALRYGDSKYEEPA